MTSSVPVRCCTIPDHRDVNRSRHFVRRNNHGHDGERRRTATRLHPRPAAASTGCAAGSPRWPRTRRRDHRGGPVLRRRVRRADGRHHRERRPDGAGRVPPAGRAAAAPPTRVPPRPRPSRAPTRWAAARRAAGAPPTPCSRRTGSAPGWPGASCRRPRSQRACPPRCWPPSPSWSSPTSTSCPRPRVAGHADELETTGRVRQRLLDRLALAPARGDPADALLAAAERADWTAAEHAHRRGRARRPGAAGAGRGLDPRTLSAVGRTRPRRRVERAAGARRARRRRGPLCCGP